MRVVTVDQLRQLKTELTVKKSENSPIEIPIFKKNDY